MTTSFSAIGLPVPQDEGPDKVSGKALYAADLRLPNMLWGKALRSPYTHANIVHIDTSRARRLPGVHTVLTGHDLPDRRVGRLLRDMPILARDRVLFKGEKVAACKTSATFVDRTPKRCPSISKTKISISIVPLPPCRLRSV